MISLWAMCFFFLRHIQCSHELVTETSEVLLKAGLFGQQQVNTEMCQTPEAG